MTVTNSLSDSWARLYKENIGEYLKYDDINLIKAKAMRATLTCKRVVALTLEEYNRLRAEYNIDGELKSFMGMEVVLQASIEPNRVWCGELKYMSIDEYHEEVEL